MSPTPLAPSPTATAAPVTGRIAYVHNSGEVGGVPVTDIWVVGANGGQPTALTGDPQNEFSPFWLLDGSRLVFAVFDYPKNPSYGRLVSVLPDGSERRDLSPVANYGDGVPSPDGRFVVWGGGGSTDGFDGITLLDLATGNARLLTTEGATDPIWSPDGTALLVQEPLLGAVAVVEVPSGRLTRFRKPHIEAVLGWTADGASIVFSGPQSETTPIWMAAANGGPVLAFPPDGQMASPAWASPDARWIVDRRLEAMPASGGTPLDLAHGLMMLTGAPSWSLGGNALTFAGSTIDEVGDRKSAIYVVGLDGRTPNRITTGPLDTTPAWGPVG